ncbi:MAG: hypothetical protein ACSI46_26055 [Gloeotrichia echinulata DVL01]|nr:hypothetical protein [Gloeotrichia echinulata DEX184]
MEFILPYIDTQLARKFGIDNFLLWGLEIGDWRLGIGDWGLGRVFKLFL